MPLPDSSCSVLASTGRFIELLVSEMDKTVEPLIPSQMRWVVEVELRFSKNLTLARRKPPTYLYSDFLYLPQPFHLPYSSLYLTLLTQFKKDITMHAGFHMVDKPCLSVASKIQPAWTSFEELTWLNQITRDKTVMEIGCFTGRSTVAMMDCRLLYALDHFKGSVEHEGHEIFKNGPDGLMLKWLENVRPWMNKIFPLRMDSTAESTKLALTGMFQRGGEWEYLSFVPPSVVFIDGAHDAESVASDLALAISISNKDAIICGHDYDPARPGVWDVINNFFQITDPEEIRGEGSIWAVRKDEGAFARLWENHENEFIHPGPT